MIDATNLRLGNWIMVAGTGEIHAVKVTIDNLRQLLVAPEYAASIPLTPEIFIQCGFKYKDECFVKETETGEIIFSDNFILQSTDSITQLKYVHQFQNLYFALTGEELNIQL